MRIYPAILLLLLFSCRTNRETIEVCGGINNDGKIKVEMVSTEETSEDYYTLWGSAFGVDLGEPMPFVKIKLVLRDTSLVSKVTGTITDIDGNFSIDLMPGIYDMEISYVGYESYASELTALEEMKEELRIELEN